MPKPPGVEEGKNYSAIAKQYAEDVASGKIPACELAVLACKRQISDLARTDWRWRFDEKAANRICRFAENLPHVKGRWASKTIIIEPWQCFILTALFGWIDSAGLRRFRTGYIEVPRKNAKTTLCAGIALFMLVADGEPGPEVYSAAVTRDQAKISWGIAKQMVSREREMRDYYGVEPLANAITVEGGGGYFKPLSRDANSLEGLSPHFSGVDEVHAHKTREVWDVLNVARGSRANSLQLAITTAGDDKTGICYEQHDYVEQILRGRHEDDRYFGIIYTIDPEDDWTTELAWRKANPNYGVSVLDDDIRTLCKQAQQSAHSQNTFLTKRLNVWVTVGTAYFNVRSWASKCKDKALTVEDFKGAPCIFALDLASKRDLTVRLALFKRDGEYYAFGKYYLPVDAIERGMPNYDFYRGWRTAGLLTVTEGNITDYTFVEHDVLEDTAKFRPLKVGVDPNYNANQLTTRLRDQGVPMVDIPQTVLALSEPMKQLDALIIAGKIHHNGDPVLEWAIGNVLAKQDVKGNVYPRKARDENKIDPAVALIGTLHLWGRESASQTPWDGSLVFI